MANLSLVEHQPEQAEHETVERNWTIHNASEYRDAAGQIRDALFDTIDEESAFIWSWFATELLVNELKHGLKLEDAMNNTTWTLPAEVSVTMQLHMNDHDTELIVESDGTVVPRSVLAPFFNVGNPSNSGESSKVFHCTPKSSSEFPEINLEDLIAQNGRGYRGTAEYLDQPGDELAIEVPTDTVLTDGSWPENTPIHHRVIIHAATHHPDSTQQLIAA